MKGLFGDEVTEGISKKPRSFYQKFKAYNNYRKALDNKRCGTCDHSRRRDYHGKYYWKCIKMGISSSEATDIRVSDVCNLYEPNK